MKHLFIINPTAGKTVANNELRAEIESVMNAKGLDYEVKFTEAPHHAAELVRNACLTGEELRIYSCGGDGTMNEVAEGAAGHMNAAVTFLPTGTGNDFIKMFGDGAEAFRNIEKLLDCEEALFDTVDICGRKSLCICSVGFDARVGTEVHKYTGIPLIGGKLAYDISLVANLIKGIHQYMKITVDGKVYDGHHTLMCVCNGRYYGGGYMPVPEAMPDDGLLDVLIVKPVSRLKFASLVGKYSKGLYREMPDLITHIRTKKIEVELDRPGPVNIDGELEFADHMTFEVSKDKIRFFYPKGTSYAPIENNC